MVRLATLLALVGCAVALTGCVERSRDAYVQDIAHTACRRFDQCGNLGSQSDAYYGSLEECQTKMENSFYDSWPEDRCGNGQINREEWKRCDDRAHSFACDANVFDVLSFASDCSADNVCIDPAR